MAGRGARAGGAPGMVVAIGGAETKDVTANPLILGRFVYAAGGKDATVIVIPIASELASTATRYRRLFDKLGARATHILHPKTWDEANDEQGVALIAGASGIFFTGGDQYRLTQRLAGTSLEAEIRAAHQRGAVVGGTSAGASYLSETMIAFGKSGSVPRRDMVTLTAGLGVTSRFIIDQHFEQRNRLGRLLTALAAHPHAIGLGLDEDTAAFISGDMLEVVGGACITIVDPRASVWHACNHHPDRHDALCMTDLALHILVHGATYDGTTGVATWPEAAHEASHA